MAEPERQPAKEESPADRVSLVQTVKTPLGFFVLVVLVVEALFALVASAAESSDRAFIFRAMVALIFFLVLLVAVLAAVRPEALRGERYRAAGAPDGAEAPLAADVQVYIRNKQSGKYLDLADWRLDDGAPVQQWDYHGGENQCWKLQPAGGEYFRIVSMHSEKCLTVPNESGDDDVRVLQYPYAGLGGQQWKFVRHTDGSFAISARHSGKFLYVEGNGRENGDKVAQKHWPQGPSQQWWIHLAAVGGG